MTDANKKILIVEDSKSYLFVLSEAIRAGGFIVITAEDGEEGLTVAEKEKPDLILLDITMPKMDGIVMAKKIREFDTRVPIIFLTNMSDVKHISDASETASDYIIKAEVSVEDILNRIKTRLSVK